MAVFQELIKNFERIRDYMRQFFVYGYKSRGDFGEKSSRTYDNERRRIESWLAGYIQSGHTQREKHVYISVDSRTIPQNPLYGAWKSKSFTDKDILLHFLLPDLLWDQPDGLTAGQLCDRIAAVYGTALDSQTLRLKLKEYEALGIFRSEKRGKSLYYRLLPGPVCPPPALPAAVPHPLSERTWSDLLCAVTYFQGTAPFGFVGSTILDHEDQEARWFRFKHLFIVHTLEDGVLAHILTAMHEQRKIAFLNKSRRSGSTSEVRGIPLKIFVSTQTGRRYVCLYLEERRRFSNFRLDSAADVRLLEPCPDYQERQQQLAQNLPRCWGVSFSGSHRVEEIYLKLYIDEEKEPYILERLRREGRGGELLKIRDHAYLYSGAFFDTNEMLSWVKTFTGRILDIQGTSQPAIGKLVGDLERMYQMYTDDPGGEPGHPPSAAKSTARSSTAGPTQASADSPAPPKAQILRQVEAQSPRQVSGGPASGPELFDKIYGCYYQAVRHILWEASSAPIGEAQMTELSMRYGYLESSLTILPKLTGGGWPLLQRYTDGGRPLPQRDAGQKTGATPDRAQAGSRPVYTSRLLHPETLLPGRLPLTKLQRAWLKSLASDPRIHLFLTDQQIRQLDAWLAEDHPLYAQEDFYYFDQYQDGDDYRSLDYRGHFQLILRAIKEKKALCLAYENRRGEPQTFEAAPYQLQYSSREDKFRLRCLRYSGRAFCRDILLNVSRIKACHISRLPVPEGLTFPSSGTGRSAAEPVVIQISGERNSLERCMLHFADHEKHTHFDEATGTWICQIYHDPADETELLIQLLSFGPVIRILGPEPFLTQVRERVRRQHDLFYQPLGYA